MSDRDRRRSGFEDDGRTIVDMSGVEGHGSLLSGMIGLRGDRLSRRKKKDVAAGANDGAAGDGASADGADDRVVLTRQERRWYIFGALKAAILIFLAFAIGLGLVILLMVLFW